MSNFELMYDWNPKSKPVKAWVKGVEFEPEAQQQLRNIATMPFIHSHLAVMPDVHAGKGSTIGTVIPTKGAIIPAAVGVDIGCGMMAVRTSLRASDLPENLSKLREYIERAVPHGRSSNGGPNDKGGWRGNVPNSVISVWKYTLNPRFEILKSKHQKLAGSNSLGHLGTLGTGNHFIEICLDEEQRVWVMLHSGSRGIGNAIGNHFISKAKRDMEKQHIHLPDKDLAYLTENTQNFDDYIEALNWAQDFAAESRKIMMDRTLRAMSNSGVLPPFKHSEMAVNCHHNYVNKEVHYGEEVFLTRKGAVSARSGELGIIPGSMGTRSYIVRGKGNPESFTSCSHGAGRRMSRGAAKRLYTIEDHIKATEGVECRKDDGVIDETPMCYKNIDDVMAAQSDLVEIVYTLKQILCVKG